MAVYRQSVVCINGREVLAKAIAGECTINFTSIKTSATQFAESELENLTGIGTIEQEKLITQMDNKGDGAVTLYASFSNADLTTGYYIRNFGIYVEDPDDATRELLYAIVNADESTVPASYLPAYNGVGVSTMDFTSIITVSSSAKITCVLDPSGGCPMSVFTAHADGEVNTETGMHGLRYYENALSVKTDEGWVEIETGGGGIAPSNVSDLRVKNGNGKATIYWQDPDDTVIDGQTICTWDGTRLVGKAGSFPENVKDGTVILDNKVRGAYATDGYEINGLTNGETYYYQLFPYSDTKAVNSNVANRCTATPQEYVVFGVDIDLTNSDPNTWATYTDDAVGMEAGSALWDDKPLFSEIASYLFKDGVEVGKLKKGDPTKFEDGSTADITSGNAGDVMTKFTRGGYKISISGNTLSIRITDNPDAEADGYSYKAFKRGSVDKDQFYLGRYKGYVSGGKMRSLSGKTPTASQTIGTFRGYAHANGDGYENSGYYQLVFRQCLYMIKYLAKNSQQAVGMGYVGASAVTTTGQTNGKGDTYGSTSTTEQMILFGLEDFWGNIWEWVDGLVCDASRNILTATDSFNDAGTGYDSFSSGLTANTGGYMTKPQGNNDGAFNIAVASGSSTTYFCDDASLYASCVARFGGYYGNGDGAGVCNLYVSYASSSSYAGIGGRLMYL